MSKPGEVGVGGGREKKKNSAVPDIIAGGLKMIYVKSFLAALKITWLKSILSSDGKNAKCSVSCC